LEKEKKKLICEEREKKKEEIAWGKKNERGRKEEKTIKAAEG